MTKWVLITGGIGSGKTTVTALFAALQVPVIDTDVLSHALTGPGGEAVAAVRKKFGIKAVTGDNGLNRTWLRQLIFTDNRAKAQLEAILHPLIFATVLAQQAATRAVYGLLAVPVFAANSPYNAVTDRILVVDCDYMTQIRRTKQRDGAAANMTAQIIKTQLPRQTRIDLADDVIVNNKDINFLKKEVARLHQYYLTLFA